MAFRAFVLVDRSRAALRLTLADTIGHHEPLTCANGRSGFLVWCSRYSENDEAQ